MTDISTGWTECRATWNKGADGVMTQIKDVQKALPLQVKGFDCYNGSEFLTWHLLRYFQSHEQPIKFTRSRPYHSNDNAHVEQKNWSCVRQLFGYDRLVDPKMVELGYLGSHSQLRARMHGLKPALPMDPVVRFETAPGEQTQVGALVEFRHGRTPLYAFCATLGYSRASFVEFVTDMKVETLIACQSVADPDHRAYPEPAEGRHASGHQQLPPADH